jgi:hypothetical protein
MVEGIRDRRMLDDGRRCSPGSSVAGAGAGERMACDTLAMH